VGHVVVEVGCVLRNELAGDPRGAIVVRQLERCNRAARLLLDRRCETACPPVTRHYFGAHRAIVQKSSLSQLA
jgi:hypothetical protein